jgi:hypothetical protein
MKEKQLNSANTGKLGESPDDAAVKPKSKVPALVKTFIATDENVKNSAQAKEIKNFDSAPVDMKSETTPKKTRGKPVYKEGDELPSEVEALDISQRPLVMRDLAGFRARHKRTTADSIRDFALPTSLAYPKDVAVGSGESKESEGDSLEGQNGVEGGSVQNKVMPFDLEMLVRLYDLMPSPCAWQYSTISGVFEKMYGELIADFDEADQPAAQLAYRRRYAQLIGRSATGAYRWKKSEATTRRMEILLTKIEALGKTGKEVRLAYEALSIKTWALRGVNINKEAPAPTAFNVQKPPGTRGRRINTNLPEKPTMKEATYEGGAFG